MVEDRSIRADQDILIRSDQADANTEDTLSAGLQEGVIEKQSPLSGAKYPAGTIFGYVKAVSATAAVRTTFAL